VKDVGDLPEIIHEAFYVARSGRPGPVVVDIPKDVQFAKGTPMAPPKVAHRTATGRGEGDDASAIEQAVEMIAKAERPVFYTGGGVINAGRGRRSCCASSCPDRLSRHLTLMGLGAFPAATSSGWACWACTAPTKPTWRCTAAT
jgi:acetolactate synthase-1/2/3 large subunit